MEKTITITSGNPIVDQVATMNLTGNIIPESWYHTIINENGKTNTLAILILADIIYWYRPTEERDETTLSVSYSKKFHDEDYLQRSYEQLMEKFNISKRQARDALILARFSTFDLITGAGHASPSKVPLKPHPQTSPSN